MEAGGGVRSAPSCLFPSSPFAPVAADARGGRPPLGGQSQPPPLAPAGPLTLLCHCLRSTFPFLQTAPVRTNFPSEVAFFCLFSSFACSSPAFFFFFFLCNHHYSNRCAPSGTRAGSASRGGAGAQRGWGWSAGAEEELRSSSGECPRPGAEGERDRT